MTAEVWYGRKPRPAFLQQAVIDILDYLAARAEHYVVLSHFRLSADHAPLDLVVLKRDGIFLVELLRAWDPIVGDTQGHWQALKPDGARLPLNADRLNPYRQVQTHYIDWCAWWNTHTAELQAAGAATHPIERATIFSYIVLYPDRPPGSQIANGPHQIQVTGLPGLLTALTLRSTDQLDLQPQQFNCIPQLLNLESPLGSAPRRPTQKLEPDYQLPHLAALIALGHDFSVPIIRLQSSEHLRVGRDDDNDMIIHHPAVSRHHAQLLRQSEGWLVRDLDSDNGTFLSPTGHTSDEQPVTVAPQLLINRAVIRFGPAAYLVSL